MARYETVKPLIMRCMLMRFNERESLDYVKEQGYQLSRAQSIIGLKKGYRIQNLID